MKRYFIELYRQGTTERRWYLHQPEDSALKFYLYSDENTPQRIRNVVCRTHSVQNAVMWTAQINSFFGDDFRIIMDQNTTRSIIQVKHDGEWKIQEFCDGRIHRLESWSGDTTQKVYIIHGKYAGYFGQIRGISQDSIMVYVENIGIVSVAKERLCYLTFLR